MNKSLGFIILLIARVLDTLITFAQQPSGPQLDSLSCVTVLEPTRSLLRTISLKWTAVCMRPACNLVDTW